MKFCIANTSYWESMGFYVENWRKSTDGKFALCHLEFAKVLSEKNIEEDNNIAVYDIQDEEFKRLLNSPEWTEEVEVE